MHGISTAGEGVDDITSALAGAGSNPATTGEHMMGTTIMAVSFDGGVVLAADSRTSTGAYIANRTSDKLTEVSEHIYCCRSGSAADTQAISDYVRLYLEQHAAELGEEASVKTAACLFRKFCYENKDSLTAGIIVGGWDKRKGGQVFSVPAYSGAMIECPFQISGSGSTYIYGYVDANFKLGMTKDECLTFCKNAVSLAMARDGSSGGIIRTCVVSEAGVERDYTSSNSGLPVHFEG